MYKERKFHEKALTLIHRKHSDFPNLFFFNLGKKVSLDPLNWLYVPLINFYPQFA